MENPGARGIPGNGHLMGEKGNNGKGKIPGAGASHPKVGVLRREKRGSIRGGFTKHPGTENFGEKRRKKLWAQIGGVITEAPRGEKLWGACGAFIKSKKFRGGNNGGQKKKNDYWARVRRREKI